ncbi:hypothetical protein BAGA_23605 [Bacillus gaemokensis]|uniref:Uncharacterized protein YyaB-like PH domain-containing protein n=1 Tax=Bacillus gaemokensis TaxID=574375 RepID=A0A073KQI9_9BACI|nr:hypothetical protein BAGA_23605 [Bacillus gaemokensis]KYG34478.1 hypothetical protein AZF08_08745 [Bacillus gaemokensis]
MKFKVKKNPIHMILFLLLTTILFVLLFIQDGDPIFFTFITLINLFNLSSLYNSNYEITESSLVVKYGFINHTEIPFENIRHVKYSGKQLDSEKWTRQRLEITYGLFDALIAFVPQEEEKFISLLTEKCPNMKVIEQKVK